MRLGLGSLQINKQAHGQIDDQILRYSFEALNRGTIVSQVIPWWESIMMIRMAEAVRIARTAAIRSISFIFIVSLSADGSPRDINRPSRTQSLVGLLNGQIWTEWSLIPRLHLTLIWVKNGLYRVAVRPQSRRSCCVFWMTSMERYYASFVDFLQACWSILQPTSKTTTLSSSKSSTGYKLKKKKKLLFV